MYVLRTAWTNINTLMTIKMGKITLQNPANYDVNWILNDKIWLCWETGVIPVPGYVESLV